MVFFILFSYEPAKGEPKIPTANSAQTSNNINKIIPQMTTLFLKLFTLLKTNSQDKPVHNSRSPATRKSKGFQLKPWPSTPVPIVNWRTRNVSISTAMLPKIPKILLLDLFVDVCGVFILVCFKINDYSIIFQLHGYAF